jgi:hypothetical protein
MRQRTRLVSRVMIAAILSAPMTLQACAGHGNVGSYYDPYYSDYHNWNGTELGYYQRWEGETGRQHMDFGRRPAEEQHAYFGWRHAH